MTEGAEPYTMKVVRAVLNGEGGETGISTALCPYPTPSLQLPGAAHTWRSAPESQARPRVGRTQAQSA